MKIHLLIVARDEQHARRVATELATPERPVSVLDDAGRKEVAGRMDAGHEVTAVTWEALPEEMSRRFPVMSLAR